jgi:hypothetical protein
MAVSGEPVGLMGIAWVGGIGGIRWPAGELRGGEQHRATAAVGGIGVARESRGCGGVAGR